MIPKIAHYCWFGGKPMPELVLRCVNSWKLYCPDYQFILWNESNFDLHCDPFVEQAYQAKCWAFVSDYVRLYALLNYGGIYMDTDIELLQSPDELLKLDCFTGFEAKDTVATGIIGSAPNHPIIARFFAQYQGKEFLRGGVRIAETSPVLFTRILVENGLRLNGKTQVVQDCSVFSAPRFYPTGFGWLFGKYPAKSICVHHYMDSWRGKDLSNGRSFGMRLRLSLVSCGRNLIGTEKMEQYGKRLLHK